MSLGVFTGGLLLTLAVVYMKRRRRMHALHMQLHQAEVTSLSRQPTLTYYEPAGMGGTMRCGAAAILMRGDASEQALSKDKQYQLMAGDSAPRNTLCNSVDLLATPTVAAHCHSDSSPLRHHQQQSRVSFSYPVGTLGHDQLSDLCESIPPLLATLKVLRVSPTSYCTIASLIISMYYSAACQILAIQ